jgi:5-oxoprolinase (ATP-hydrolysing)
MMQIHTVAAGGGSILHFDGARYRVGPDSAGANPGPACYRRGGPLCVTDANVMLGKIQPEFFPKVFGPGGDQPLDAAIVRAKFAALAAEIRARTGNARTPAEVAAGFIKIAVENMANAIKEISIQRGYDVTEYTLQCFGGAGGQHACLVADALGMTRIFIHPFAGVLSAYGMGLADVRALRERAIEAKLDAAALPGIARTLDALAEEARRELLAQGIGAASVEVIRRLHVKIEGTDTALVVEFGSLAEIGERFDAAHKQRFGFVVPDKARIVEAASVEAIGRTETGAHAALGAAPRRGPLAPLGRVAMHCDGAERDTPVYDREALAPGDRVDGPAIIIEANATTIVEPGWRAEPTPLGPLVLTRVVALDRGKAVGTEVDPVMLEVFNNLFMSIAEQMGSVLENTSYSVNMKERLDFSCAIFDPLGDLIANAPHMPVHLGSMSESVKTIIRERAGKMNPGDVYVLNAPYNGGTHLPDVTVITPVFDSGGKILFYVGARGHHADIGGITPGSMPPDSKTVEEEGVLFDNFLLVDRGNFREEALRAHLASGRYPARNPYQNVADLKAQIAACAKGAQELERMIGEFGLDVVHAYMKHVQDNAEEQVRRVLGALKDGAFETPLDNGGRIKVAITVDRQRRAARLDFTGTSPQLPTNFNAPSAVCRAAVLYVFRTLVDDEIPMNEGVLKPLDIVIEEGSMLRPGYPAAVVAGNVETSQLITETLYGALGIQAAGQSTMNNVTFGNEKYQYYETVAGGAGAGPGYDGASCVQIHMTNSRLTDPEVLEWRFPVLLEDFRIRRGSGGKGTWRGGDGAIRRIRFLEPMTVSILSSRRAYAPFGMAGGAPGAKGRNWVERAHGPGDAPAPEARVIVPMTGTDKCEVGPGDVFVVETPGGGGYGAAE